MIIGIVGFIASGKDTIADYLVNNHDFQRVSFAGSLKDSLSHIFGWDRELLEGQTVQSREWREQVDQWWSDRLQIENLTPRKIMQLFGTDTCRQHFHTDIWVASLENKLRNITTNVVVTDCRFPNELQSIRNVGGKIVRVSRGPEPKWFTSAESFNKGPNGNLSWAISKHHLQKIGVHQSEWAWVGKQIDTVIDNNGSLDELYDQVTRLVQDHQFSTQAQVD